MVAGCLFCLIFPIFFCLRHFGVAYFVLFLLIFFCHRHFGVGQVGWLWPFWFVGGETRHNLLGRELRTFWVLGV